MIKTPLSTVIGGAFWTPSATILGGTSKTFDQIIKSIFANNKQGVAYDPNDLTTMWQDQAKLLPVTGEGQPVWHILDKSGNNNHAFATSSATRPILRQNAITGAYYLAFDGTDDFLQTNNIDFTTTDKVSLFAGVRKLSDLGSRLIVELSEDPGNIGSFSLLAPGSSGAYSYSAAANKGSLIQTGGGSFAPSPDSSVVTAKVSNNISISTNGVLRSEVAAAGSSNFSQKPLYIGRRGGTSLSFNGHLYGLIGIGKLVLGNETAVIEKELAKRVGVTLNV